MDVRLALVDTDNNIILDRPAQIYWDGVRFTNQDEIIMGERYGEPVLVDRVLVIGDTFVRMMPLMQPFCFQDGDNCVFPCEHLRMYP